MRIGTPQNVTHGRKSHLEFHVLPISVDQAKEIGKGFSFLHGWLDLENLSENECNFLARIFAGEALRLAKKNENDSLIEASHEIGLQPPSVKS